MVNCNDMNCYKIMYTYSYIHMYNVHTYIYILNTCNKNKHFCREGV